MLFGYSLLITHNRRTIDALFTHYKRTIPITSVKDEDTISVFTPYTLRHTLSLLLRLPSLLSLLSLASKHRPTSERRPREERSVIVPLRLTKPEILPKIVNLIPKKVDLIPEKVVTLPKKVD